MKKILLCCLTFLLVASAYSKSRKALYIVLDGISADYIERVHPKTIFEIAHKGGYARAYTGGEIGTYSQTPTISAIGYMNMLTGTWMNKHHVTGNSNLQPNYYYWSLFRIAKEQAHNYKTAIFSSWTDNRKVLIGEGKPETGHLQIDYAYDGFEYDKTTFPNRAHDLHIFDIDSVVCQKAATCIRNDAPDLSWVYLWYTDAGYHLYGDGQFMDEYVNKTDEQIRRIWEAVQYREKNYDEEWMVIVTTDHGRTESGYGHGGQTARERSVWMSTNHKKLNAHFGHPSLSLVDILPTICKFMDFKIPRDVYFEQDGIPFIGKVDIHSLTTHPYDDTVTLRWESNGSREIAKIYLAVSNHFMEGAKDEWMEVGSVPAKRGEYVIDLSKYASSKFYKFVVETPNQHLTRWMYK